MIELFEEPVFKYYLSAALAAYPVWRIYRRAGLRGAYTAILIIPFAGFVLCMGALALQTWPNVPKKAKEHV